MSEPLILPRNCSNCQHFDEDYCTLPSVRVLVQGYIKAPARVTCAEHEPKDADDVEGAAV